MYLLNAFSLSMLPAGHVAGRLSVRRLTAAEARDHARTSEAGAALTSYVGHESTASIFAAVLGVPVQANRVSVTLPEYAHALVGQYVGPRLPEGARIDWFLVSWEGDEPE